MHNVCVFMIDIASSIFVLARNLENLKLVIRRPQENFFQLNLVNLLKKIDLIVTVSTRPIRFWLLEDYWKLGRLGWWLFSWKHSWNKPEVVPLWQEHSHCLLIDANICLTPLRSWGGELGMVWKRTSSPGVLGVVPASW